MKEAHYLTNKSILRRRNNDAVYCDSDSISSIARKIWKLAQESKNKKSWARSKKGIKLRFT